MNLAHAVARQAAQNSGATAYFGAGEEITYGDLHRGANQLAHVLVEHFGVKRGDRVALYVPNGSAVIEVLVACATIGAVYVGLNFRLDEKELGQVLDNAEPSVLLGCEEYEKLLRQVAGQRSIHYVSVDGADYQELCGRAPEADRAERFEVSAQDDACIVYSSGTTGVPKGILFSHAAVLQHATIAALEYDINPGSRYLLQLPHNSSVNITIAPCLVRGAALGMEDSRGFSPSRFASRVARDQVTHTFLVPTMLYRLLEQLEDDTQLDSLVVLGYGSSSIPADRVRELVQRFGPKFIQLYGMAEIASIGTLLRREDHARAVEGAEQLFAAAGRQSMGVVVRVVDPDSGSDVDPGERGEVIFGGPHVMTCYYRDEERTSDALRNGWMRSGDIGRLDEEGYLYIVDRLKDLVIRGGHNIAPKEIEEVIYSHPSVLEVAVVGLPDAEWGEYLCATVVPRSGSVLSPHEVIEWCRAQGLASIKTPSRVEIFADLPKNLVGKFDKKAIVSLLGPPV